MGSKQIDTIQEALLVLLKLDGNNVCADCEAKAPRWASWNIGVFICIRCAGIHRNMGVHLSKVKSVNLDTWTLDQVKSMEIMGNRRAKDVFEYDLPDHFQRPKTESALEIFIRAKYEHKRYFLREFVHPTMSPDALKSFAARNAPKPILKSARTSCQCLDEEVPSELLIDLSPCTLTTQGSYEAKSGCSFETIPFISPQQPSPSTSEILTQLEGIDFSISTPNSHPAPHTATERKTIEAILSLYKTSATKPDALQLMKCIPMQNAAIDEFSEFVKARLRVGSRSGK